MDENPVFQELYRLFQCDRNPDLELEDWNVLDFWFYLVCAHRKIRYRDKYPDRDDNILKFMTDFKIDETRVVILAQDPPEDEASFGYAYHKSMSVSTHNLLANLKSEYGFFIKLGAPDLQLEPIQHSNPYYDDLRDMEWWIKQSKSGNLQKLIINKINV